MQQKVGRIALAIALIILGTVWIVDTWQQTQIARFVAHLWPALLIIVGVEWVVLAGRGAQPRVDGGAMALLAILALIAANFGGGWHWPIESGYGMAIAVPASPSSPLAPTAPPEPTPGPSAWAAPSIPSVPAVPRFFSAPADEVLLTHDGDAAGMEELQVDGGGAGAIRVEQGDQFRVELHVTGYTSDEINRLVRLRVQPGRITRVRVDRPDSLPRLGLSFLVTVPPGVKLNLDTASGAIAVAGREADVNAQTSSGSIRIDDVKGAVRASSASGSVAVRQVSGKVSAQAVSGSVSVSTDQVGGDYELTTTSGSVSLVIPPTASVSVNARTTSGSVMGPAWLSRGEGRSERSGQQGAGQYKVAIRTTSGSVRIEAR